MVELVELVKVLVLGQEVLLRVGLLADLREDPQEVLQDYHLEVQRLIPALDLGYLLEPAQAIPLVTQARELVVDLVFSIN